MKNSVLLIFFLFMNNLLFSQDTINRVILKDGTSIYGKAERINVIKVVSSNGYIEVFDADDVLEIKDELYDPLKHSELNIGRPYITRYTLNTWNNPYSEDMTLYGKITTIPSKSSQTFEVGNTDTIIVFRKGFPIWVIKTYVNHDRLIEVNRVFSMNDTSKARNLQNNVCYKVSIEDDFPSQLKIKFKGPVKVVKDSTMPFINNSYLIYLNAFKNKEEFENFINTDLRDEPYSISCSIEVSDEIARVKIEKQILFIFGKW